MNVVVRRPGGPWAILDGRAKLLARGALPGAYGYDLAAHGARVARARGVGMRELLALAMPASWMVNSQAPSPVFRRWLSQQGAEWASLASLLACGALAWPDAPDAERAEVDALCRRLAAPGHGACALSKVLAVLCPQTVPLMDDAALAFALGAVATPDTADKPVAGPEHVVPMLDWFAAAARDNEGALVALARDYALAPLDAPQVLDRLLWVESWGWRKALSVEGAGARFWWVADEAREGIVVLDAPHPGFASGARVELGEVADGAWRARAREALAPAG